MTAFEGFKINILGKSDYISVHFCDKCRLSVKTDRRMIPCKHLPFTMTELFYMKRGEKEIR